MILLNREDAVYSWLSLVLDLALDLTQMVLEVLKNLKLTQFFIPNSFR